MSTSLLRRDEKRDQLKRGKLVIFVWDVCIKTVPCLLAVCVFVALQTIIK